MSNTDKVAANNMFEKLEVWFDGLKPREQKLIFFGIPVTILIVIFLLLLEPLLIQTQKSKADIARLESQRQSTQASVTELLIQAKVDPDIDIKRQIGSLTKRLFKIDKAFDIELGQLVSPDLMPVLLEQLFAHANDLHLLSMQSNPPEILFSDRAKTMPIYRHGMDITFEGGFFATRDFLAAAEDMGWKLYWQSLKYEVDQYPSAKTQLSLFTLSTSEAFISVK